MLEFILGLNELTISLYTFMLLALLTAIYRVNIRFSLYATDSGAWKVTEKMNTLGKYLMIGGGLATLPFVLLLLFSPGTHVSSSFLGVTYTGYLTLIVAMPVMLAAFLLRLLATDLSMPMVLKALFKTIKTIYRVVNWHTVILWFAAMTLLVFLWPAIKILLYIAALGVLARFGLLGSTHNTDQTDLFIGAKLNAKYDLEEQNGLW